MPTTRAVDVELLELGLDLLAGGRLGHERDAGRARGTALPVGARRAGRLALLGPLIAPRSIRARLWRRGGTIVRPMGGPRYWSSADSGHAGWVAWIGHEPSSAEHG